MESLYAKTQCRVDSEGDSWAEVYVGPRVWPTFGGPKRGAFRGSVLLDRRFHPPLADCSAATLCRPPSVDLIYMPLVLRWLTVGGLKAVDSGRGASITLRLRSATGGYGLFCMSGPMIIVIVLIGIIRFSQAGIRFT